MKVPEIKVRGGEANRGGMLVWGIERRREKEENVQQGSRNRVDLTTGGETDASQAD